MVDTAYKVDEEGSSHDIYHEKRGEYILCDIN